MKQLFHIIALALIGHMAQAQWTSPGNGQSYTLDELAQIAPATVTGLGAFAYEVNGDITISENDTIIIEPTSGIQIANEVLVTIKGSMICLDGHDADSSFITGKDGGVYNWRFENARHNYLKNIHFSRCGGIKIMESEICIHDCEFAGFNTQYCPNVIDFFQCDPRIHNCSFHDNQGPAIGSGANIQGSPEIVNCVLFNNVTDNVNKPQINIGPSGVTPIRIEGNRIEGLGSDMVGGIAITNLSNETTLAIVANNRIAGNRYGYTQMGYGFDVEFKDNDIIDNNLETNPMNGGSGLSIYGMGNNCNIKLRNNNITGNLWGITAINVCNIDLGTENDPGNNAIYGNGNGGTRYELYNNTANTLNAIGNYWGSNTPDEVENVIFHQPDQASLGLVNFLPIKELHPVMLDFAILAEDNYPMQGDYHGVIDQENHTITVNIMENCDLDNIVVRYRTDIGVCGAPESGALLDLNETAVISLSTFHGESQEYQLSVNTPEHVAETIHTISAFPNPSQGNISFVFHESEARIELYNTLGQNVLTIDNYISGDAIDLGSLQVGTYFAAFSFGKNKKATTKITLSK